MKQAIRLYKKTFGLTGDFTIENCRGCTLSADNNGHLIYLPKWTNDSKHLAILCHESTHVANRVLQQVGFKFPGWDNDEPFAYLQSYIFEHCLIQIYKAFPG